MCIYSAMYGALAPAVRIAARHTLLLLRQACLVPCHHAVSVLCPTDTCSAVDTPGATPCALCFSLRPLAPTVCLCVHGSQQYPLTQTAGRANTASQLPKAWPPLFDDHFHFCLSTPRVTVCNIVCMYAQIPIPRSTALHGV